jgi:hypothetical protein
MSPIDVSRRKFFMHPAHPAIGVSNGLAALQACQPTAGCDLSPQPARPLHVCLLTGAASAGSHDSRATLSEHLAAHSVHCSAMLCGPDSPRRAFETLDDVDCLILLSPAVVSAAMLEQIDGFCRHGGALIGLQAVAGAFQGGGALARRLLGVACAESAGERPSRIGPAAAVEDHRVLCGIADFLSPVARYKSFHLAADATVLLSATLPSAALPSDTLLETGVPQAAGTDRSQPVAWVRPYHEGRIFGTSLGRADDFQTAPFRRLLLNALFWATRRSR